MERQTKSGKSWWQRLTQKEEVPEEEIDLTLPQLREAIHEYEQTLPKGVNRSYSTRPKKSIWLD